MTAPSCGCSALTGTLRYHMISRIALWNANSGRCAASGVAAAPPARCSAACDSSPAANRAVVMDRETHRVRQEFDRIALLTERCGGERVLYLNYLLRQLPSECDSALEIGCGTGVLTRQIAARARRVVGVDLSPEMLRLARLRSTQHLNIEYVLGDIMQLALPRASYDCIVSVATLHHLPLEQSLRKIDGLLKPGGVLIIHDLLADEGLVERCRSVLAMPFNLAVRFWKTGQFLLPRQLREAWAVHGQDEIYMTLHEVTKMCAQHLPKAHLRRHLLWRYTVVWRKGGGA